MKRKFLFASSIVLMGLTMMLTSCGDDDEGVVPGNTPDVLTKSSLAGQQWTLVEGDETSVFTFLTETAMSVLVSPNVKAVTEPTTYEGTYVYNKQNKTATFNYNGNIRNLTDINISGGTVSCVIDGVEASMTTSVTPNSVQNDKVFLENTGKEFVGLFNKDQFKRYTSIYKALEKTNARAVSDELGDAIDGLVETVSETSALKHYRYVLRMATVKGEYTLGNDGKWSRNPNVGDNVHKIIFKDADERVCEVTATTSGNTKEVYLYSEKRKYDDSYGYYDYSTGMWQVIEGEKYTKKKEYLAVLPENMQVVVKQGATQLAVISVNIDLSNIREGQKIDPTRDSFGTTFTMNFKDIADVTGNISYAAQGESKAGFTVKKNNRTILTASASVKSNLTSTSLENFDEDDKNNLGKATFSIDILGKIQLKGESSKASTLINALEERSDKYELSSVQNKVNKANNAVSVKMYYNKTSDVRGWLNLAIDSKEVNEIVDWRTVQRTDYWGTYETIEPIYGVRTRYDIVSAINFSDGSSYFVEKYFTEDAFKSLVDQFNSLYDEVEEQL